MGAPDLGVSSNSAESKVIGPTLHAALATTITQENRNDDLT